MDTTNTIHLETQLNDDYVTHASRHYFVALCDSQRRGLITIKLVTIRKMSHFMIFCILYSCL